MFKISGTTMYLTRGDTLDVTVSILNADGSDSALVCDMLIETMVCDIITIKKRRVHG
jgi:hypothetical protein